jgi:hypothetical protein
MVERKRSTPRISMIPTTGTVPVVDSVAARITKPAPATPALPFDVTRNTASSPICCQIDRSIPNACAM